MGPTTRTESGQNQHISTTHTRETSKSSLRLSRVPSQRQTSRAINRISELRDSLRLSASIDRARALAAETPAGIPEQNAKLQSQFPRDSDMRHVDYILVASFDIDKGPIMEHQYPAPISDDSNMLAELMLPDQTHLRREDWTIFFLHQSHDEDIDQDKEQKRQEKRRKRTSNPLRHNGFMTNGASHHFDSDSSDADEDLFDEGKHGLPAVHVLSLVNTRTDMGVKRGAVVKAMAICTRHPFLQVFKPLLLLAIDQYFKIPSFETIGRLYDAINATDLSLMPKLTILERHVMTASQDPNLFVEKFQTMIKQRREEDQDETTNYVTPKDTHVFESTVDYLGIPVPLRVPSALTPDTVGDFSIVKLIQTFSAPHASNPQPFPLHPHLTTNGPLTHPILILINAMITQKRVIFLGHNRPSGEVAEAVLAACCLASGGYLRTFTQFAFPYTDLSAIDDILNIDGFIAGVTNPAFESHPEWWDLFCDLSSGKMKISPKIVRPVPSDGIVSFQQTFPAYAPKNDGSLPNWPTSTNNPTPIDSNGEAAFMDMIVKSINDRVGEHFIRSKFREFTVKFLQLAETFEEQVYGVTALDFGYARADEGVHGVSGHGYVWPDEAARAKDLAASAWRIEGWRTKRSYYAYIQDITTLFKQKPIRNLDIRHQLERLRVLKLGATDAAAIYFALNTAIQSHDDICQLLVLAIDNPAGLSCVGLGLFHPDKTVRHAVCGFLSRVLENDAGKHFTRLIGGFAMVALKKVKREIETGSRVLESEHEDSDDYDDEMQDDSSDGEEETWP